MGVRGEGGVVVAAMVRIMSKNGMKDHSRTECDWVIEFAGPMRMSSDEEVTTRKGRIRRLAAQEGGIRNTQTGSTLSRIRHLRNEIK
uniref:Uncharacterized protein n=1 Tax=Anguilla anguilla TaxID=7936 RepID=A0A0E9TYL2_ANGAN